MRKGEQTRQYIIMKAAEIFNQRGYFGASMADIMQATGLGKGGIYNHFDSKDDLALAAFDYAIGVLRQRYAQAIKRKCSSTEQLIAIVSIYKHIIEHPPLTGGCPLLNTAIESDDTHPALRDKAREAMDEFLAFIQLILRRGMRKEEIRSTVNPESVSIYITSTMEGAVMMSKLYHDSSYMHQALTHLSEYIGSLASS